MLIVKLTFMFDGDDGLNTFDPISKFVNHNMLIFFDTLNLGFSLVFFFFHIYTLTLNDLHVLSPYDNHDVLHMHDFVVHCEILILEFGAVVYACIYDPEYKLKKDMCRFGRILVKVLVIVARGPGRDLLIIAPKLVVLCDAYPHNYFLICIFNLDFNF